MRLMGLLGSGTYGSVYATDNDMAVKVIKKQSDYDCEAIARCRDIFIGSLSSVRSHSVFLPGMNVFGTVSYLADCTLADLAPPGLLPLHVRRILGKLLIDEIAHFHAEGVIHRDIKLQNVVVYWKPLRLKLIDFGLSVISQSSMEDEVYSLWFRAPEILDKNAHSQAADIWAFGVLLASWCGQQELVSTDIPELRKKIDEMNIQAPGMDDVLQACLQRDPSKRATAQQIASMCFWVEVPSLAEEQEAMNILKPFGEYEFAEPKAVEDPQVFVFPGYTSLKLNQFHMNVLVQIGKEFCLTVNVLNEIALLANLGMVHKARILVCAAAYIGICIFSDARLSVNRMAKLARVSRECMKSAVDQMVAALGGCLLPDEERRYIFASAEWAPVQTVLKKHFD
jgi:serine/threonine protein kinase